jgi:uncharacterized Zn finger protein
VAGDRAAPQASRLGTATLYCESCRAETLHRVLRLDRGTGGPRSLAGVARCRECRWTHRFVSVQGATAPVVVVLSHGSRSERRAVEIEASAEVRVGGRLPGFEPGSVVRRIDLRAGGGRDVALAHEVGTVWAVAEGARTVRLAVMSGSRSTTERLAAPPGARFAVGEIVRARSGPVTVVGLRARSRTWRRPGDAFPAEEVGVVYGRRTEIPPAGRRDWSRGRGTPSSRANSISAAARSRSSPGRRRKRTVPRARTADGGATERNSSRS